ncbi:MAG: paraslipin [Bdellovibrio sp. CG10_big_fil_rev_8_21_14_0_10_47_8]|nr:MAG: paraslipin [Bdellovibrio sp. CG10_big_fil_rev_8_21_14_0_10_47_8]
MELLVVAIVVFSIIFVVLTVRIVPQQSAYIIERLGKYSRTIEAGLHITIPFVDRIAYRADLKEMVLDIPPQICITKDNVQVTVDGVIFYRVIDSKAASYGVNDYEIAIVQLAQTTLRSEIGKIDLDKSFEDRERINTAIVMGIDAATQPWGVKVLRYEIKSINPPKDVLDAMEKQMRAEREKRAKILESEATRDSLINNAEGRKQDMIKQSEADKQRQINQAHGQAEAILSVARATAEGTKLVAAALAGEGGKDAAALRVAEEYVKQLGNMATNSDLLIVPSNVGDPNAIIASAFSVFDRVKSKQTSV